MQAEIHEAIESARTIAFDNKRHSRRVVIALVLGVIRELPEDLMVGQLREELEDG